MKPVINSSQAIGINYPTETGRLKQVISGSALSTNNGLDHDSVTPLAATKVALLGDSTIDNGFWVQKELSYAEKTHTVTHQTATALAGTTNSQSYEIANFAVDGATTDDLLHKCPLNKVLPTDEDHDFACVHQLNDVANWNPNVVVLSVAGNNYREALMGTLMGQLNYPQLLFRITPDQAKPIIKQAFNLVKTSLLEDYKKIIDNLIANNPKLNRIVLLSQYYPSITEFTPYFIYTGFSHLARSQGKGQDPFTAVEETMNELYKEILQYLATKDKEIVFADVTSSLNPLGGNHTHQIEPNEQGSTIMGRLIAKAVEYTFPVGELAQDKKTIALLRMTADEQHIESQLIAQSEIPDFKVKKIIQFINENRYHHLGAFFSPSASLGSRYENAYQLVMGKQFDMEYTGLFAFGLLDLSLVSLMASYLWRVAINDNLHVSLRIVAGVLAAPILISKMVLGLSLMLALALPIYGYHKIVNSFSGSDELDPNNSTHARDAEGTDMTAENLVNAL
jgi:hypothetical protein